MAVNTSHPLFHLALLFQRAAFGVFILLAGIGKFQWGVDNFVHGYYAKMTPAFLPHFIAVPYGYAVPFLEVITGSLLILGLIARPVAIIQFLMVTSFTIALVFASTPAGKIDMNVIDLSVLFMLVIAGPGRYSIDHLWRGRPR